MTDGRLHDARELKPDSSQYRSWVARVDPVLVPLVVVLIVVAIAAGVTDRSSGQAAVGLLGLVALGAVGVCIARDDQLLDRIGALGHQDH